VSQADKSTAELSPTELLRRYQLFAKKSWGQCFLHDRKIVEAIVDAAQLDGADRVLEIGAGLGILTVALARRVKRVIAIERDRELVTVLGDVFSELDNVELIAANALEFDYSAFDPPIAVIGNLPYNISSPILFRLLEQRSGISSVTIMLQRELAERIASPPGSRTYGAPSVICQHLAQVKTCLHVGRGAFTPPPNVDSTVIHLALREQISTPTLLDAVVKAAFGQRRKTLLRALSSRFEKTAVKEALSSSGIPSSERAEKLDPEAFVALAEALEALGS